MQTIILLQHFCTSVCPFVTRWCCVKTTTDRRSIKLHGNLATLVSWRKHIREIPMKSPNGTSNTGGVQNIGNFSATVCKTVRAVCYRTVVCPLLFVSLSVTLVYCGQTVGWIKMPLGSEVELGPGHIVLDGDPTPPTQRGTAACSFRPCLLWSNGRPSQQLLSSCWQTSRYIWETVKWRVEYHNFLWPLLIFKVVRLLLAFLLRFVLQLWRSSEEDFSSRKASYQSFVQFRCTIRCRTICLR